MRYVIAVLVFLIITIYGFQIRLPTGHGVLTISSEYRVEGQQESYDGYVPKYK